MTNREEIERLLNMTGRTLEGMPITYPHDKYMAVGRIYGVVPAMAGNTILHQSDVIELLIGALRDVLEERDLAVGDLKLISHCFTCANRKLDKSEQCINSGGGGVPFMRCPGYVWDKEGQELHRKHGKE